MWLNDRDREEYWNMIRKLYYDKDDDVFEFMLVAGFVIFTIALLLTISMGRAVSS